MPTVTITLPGEPRGKGRPRFARGHAYTPQSTRSYTDALAMTAKVEMIGKPLFDGPLLIQMLAAMPIPASWPLKKQQAAIRGELWPLGKPDLDNFGKLAMDAFNGIVWRDDSTVVKATMEKRYSVSPCLVVTVSTL